MGEEGRKGAWSLLKRTACIWSVCLCVVRKRKHNPYTIESVVAYRGDVALHLKFIIGSNNDAHQWSVHMRLLMPSRMFWISHFVGERTPRECVSACVSEMENKLVDTRMHEEKGTNVPPYNNIDCTLAYTILNEYYAEAQQARFFTSIRISSFALQQLYGLGGTQCQKKWRHRLAATTAITKATMVTEKKVAAHTHTHRVGHIHDVIRYCIRFRHSSERLGIVCDGTWSCGKWKRRKKHIYSGMQHRMGGSELGSCCDLDYHWLLLSISFNLGICSRWCQFMTSDYG